MAGMAADGDWWNELMVRTGARRGIDFDPLTDRAEAALREIADRVRAASEQLTEPDERRWLSHALTASAQQVRAHDPAPPAPEPDAPEVAVAVVTGPRGVLAGRRADGVPAWVLPGGTIEPGESPGRAAAREVFEECRLLVEPGAELGRRRHPTTGRHLVYVDCRPADNTDEATLNAPDELAEVRWLDAAEAGELMPDLYRPVRAHLTRAGGEE